jgi:ankyrin repeat protein
MRTDEFLQAARNGQTDRLQHLAVEDSSLVGAHAASGETPLMAALYAKQTAAVEWLVASGAPLDIFAAAALGRLDRLETLLPSSPSGGAGVNSYSYDGWTPLHLAAFFGQRAAAERLLTAGASLNAVSTNALRNTPLHAAVAGGHVDVALLLIDAAADVNAVDAGGHTPFHIAAEAGYLPVAKALLARNADAHIVDAEDRTPLSRAVSKGHTEIVDLINVKE